MVGATCGPNASFELAVIPDEGCVGGPASMGDAALPGLTASAEPVRGWFAGVAVSSRTGNPGPDFVPFSHWLYRGGIPDLPAFWTVKRKTGGESFCFKQLRYTPTIEGSIILHAIHGRRKAIVNWKICLAHDKPLGQFTHINHTGHEHKCFVGVGRIRCSVIMGAQ